MANSEFYIRTDRNTPISVCRTCTHLSNQKMWASLSNCEKKDRMNKARDWKDEQIRNGNFKVYVTAKINSYKNTAKKRGLPFDLSVKYLVDLFDKQQRLCYYTGKPLVIRSNRGLGEKCINLPDSHYQASLDRLTPEKGYIEGNVVWCGWLVNTCKNLLTEDNFYDMCDVVLKQRAVRRNLKCSEVKL